MKKLADFYTETGCRVRLHLFERGDVAPGDPGTMRLSFDMAEGDARHAEVLIDPLGASSMQDALEEWASTR